MSETEIIRMIAAQGPWAVLFVALLFFTMREGAKREERLMVFLSALEESLRRLADKYQGLCDDISEIKRDVHELKEWQG